jgi:hypothetical protein
MERHPPPPPQAGRKVIRRKQIDEVIAYRLHGVIPPNPNPRTADATHKQSFKRFAEPFVVPESGNHARMLCTSSANIEARSSVDRSRRKNANTTALLSPAAFILRPVLSDDTDDPLVMERLLPVLQEAHDRSGIHPSPETMESYILLRYYLRRANDLCRWFKKTCADCYKKVRSALCTRMRPLTAPS